MRASTASVLGLARALGRRTPTGAPSTYRFTVFRETLSCSATSRCDKPFTWTSRLIVVTSSISSIPLGTQTGLCPASAPR